MYILGLGFNKEAAFGLPSLGRMTKRMMTKGHNFLRANPKINAGFQNIRSGVNKANAWANRNPLATAGVMGTGTAILANKLTMPKPPRPQP